MCQTFHKQVICVADHVPAKCLLAYQDVYSHVQELSCATRNYKEGEMRVIFCKSLQRLLSLGNKSSAELVNTTENGHVRLFAVAGRRRACVHRAVVSLIVTVA